MVRPSLLLRSLHSSFFTRRRTTPSSAFATYRLLRKSQQRRGIGRCGTKSYFQLVLFQVCTRVLLDNIRCVGNGRGTMREETRGEGGGAADFAFDKLRVTSGRCMHGCTWIVDSFRGSVVRRSLLVVCCVNWSMWNKELSCIVPGRYTRPCDTLWSKLDTRIRKTSETARAREDNAEDNADGGENEGGLSALLAFDKRRDA